MSTNPSESGLNHKNGDLEEGFVFATLKAPMRCFSSKKTTEPKNSQRVKNSWRMSYISSGQIIATSHEFSPKMVFFFKREIPVFQGNLGW